MDAQERVDRFDFDDDSAVHDQIEAIACFDSDRVVAERKQNLATNVEASGLKFVGQAEFVGRFQKSRPEDPMDLKSAVHHDGCDAFGVLRETFVFFVFFVVHVLHFGSPHLSGQVATLT